MTIPIPGTHRVITPAATPVVKDGTMPSSHAAGTAEQTPWTGPGSSGSPDAADQDALLVRAIKQSPLLINIFSHDGTLVYANDAVCSQYGITRDQIDDEAIGKYNVLEDESILLIEPARDLQRAFQGETVHCTDVKIPPEVLATRYRELDDDMEAIYQDIMNFPLTDSEGQVIYVVGVQVVKKVYRGRLEIERAKRYIEEHWRDDFSLLRTAQVSGLSRTHFSRLFKKNAGMTPHRYYVDIKIKRIKAFLADPNLSVSQAFSACGVQYHGHSARVFKERTGLSPSQYRKSLGQA
ncbi:helix-turn-helix domain-containing protein [Acidipropionibacterium virtanenii]|nr:helix-turn-helix domain-containing protein [Acidipropionibacterium virtanenii]